MVASATAEPYYPAVFRSTLIKEKLPVHTFAGTPPAQFQQQAVNFASQFNAVNTMVYAYAGALLFVAFMAEMRNPMDFWKGLFCAQAFICVVYLLFGVYVSFVQPVDYLHRWSTDIYNKVYSNYGQYSINTIVNVIQPYSLQTVGNIFTLLTGFIACCEYSGLGSVMRLN